MGGDWAAGERNYVPRRSPAPDCHLPSAVPDEDRAQSYQLMEEERHANKGRAKQKFAHVVGVQEKSRNDK